MSTLDQEPSMSQDQVSRANSFWDGSPKTLFFMGLFLGLAVSATVGLTLVLGALWTGKGLVPSTVAQAEPSPDYVDPGADPSGGAPAPAPKPVKGVDDKADHVLGKKNAKVTLIEYSDFECPYCRRFADSVKQISQAFPNDVRIVYRHFPLSGIHPTAQKAAEASECAAKLGGNDKFWKMHDKIFEKAASGLSVAVLYTAAKDVGLDEKKFKSCLDSGEMAPKVSADFASGNDAGVQGTPASFINGQAVDGGALPFEQLKPMLQAAGANG